MSEKTLVHSFSKGGKEFRVYAVDRVKLTNDELKATINWIHNKPGAPKPISSHIIEVWHITGDFLEKWARRHGKTRKGYQLI